MVGMLFISVVIPVKLLWEYLCIISSLFHSFCGKITACFSTVHKPDANVDYTLFDYVIFPFQSIT